MLLLALFLNPTVMGFISYLQWCMSHKPNMKSVGSKSVRVAVISATATQWQCVHGGRLVGLVGNVCSACVYVWWWRWVSLNSTYPLKFQIAQMSLHNITFPLFEIQLARFYSFFFFFIRKLLETGWSMWRVGKKENGLGFIMSVMAYWDMSAGAAVTLFQLLQDVKLTLNFKIHTLCMSVCVRASVC